VPALAVVERLDVLEHRRLELEPRRPAAAVDELLLQSREERLGDGVVVVTCGLSEVLGVRGGFGRPWAVGFSRLGQGLALRRDVSVLGRGAQPSQSSAW
jgi:hypothetical protein